MHVNRHIRNSIICATLRIRIFLEVLKNTQTDIYIEILNLNRTQKRRMCVT